MKYKIIFLSGLNGLRAIAAIAVVISHITLIFDTFNSDFRLFGVDKNGNPNAYLLASYGVTIFFVLSGFLITYLLMLEKEKKPINIKSFYIRRILRIWPLYYFYLMLVLLTVYVVNDSVVSLKTLFFVVFFSTNIPSVLGNNLPYMHHFWSIGVEEQFYLFWPALVKKSKNNLVYILIFFIVTLNVIRVLLWYFVPYSLPANLSIVNRFDCMMIGGLGAIFYYQNNKLFLNLLDNKIAQFLSLLILGLLIINKFHINAIVDTFIISIVSLTVIIGQIGLKNRLINLNHKVFDFLGKISFGIYIYHPLIIFYVSKLFMYVPLTGYIRAFSVYFSVLSITIIVAYLSFHH
ncbi:MAG: acyltransferase, partial [Flavobacterium sp.]|nr:acyltransferase [Flavobacterium sp.]